MSQVFSQTIKATLPQLVQHYSQPQYQHHSVELWVFNDGKRRLEAQKRLARAGVTSRVRSAYKPLVHAMLEELLAVVPQTLDSVTIHYPVSQDSEENRFLLESYPLGALVGAATLTFLPVQRKELTYDVELHLTSGEQIHRQVYAPNSIKHSATGEHNLSPTGWVRVRDPNGRLVKDERIVTDYEQVFDSILMACREHRWPQGHFEELNIQVAGPLVDEPLAHDHECISLGEALHEDIYFSLQEWFRFRAGLNVDDRGFRFGQIIPNVEYQAGDYHIAASLDQYDVSPQQDDAGKEQDLHTALAPLTPSQLAWELDHIEGEPLVASSVAGRRVKAIYHVGSDHPVVISGGQHANESTGVVGSLRAAKALLARKGGHFVISPQENPDGYAVFHRLLAANPTHMHHAARYTALGNDLSYHAPDLPYENGIRIEAFSKSRAKFHINLHGYPSHEWVRPFSGYIPSGFGMWTIPKGFFLILRYSDPAVFHSLGKELLTRLTKKLSSIDELSRLNERQMRLFQLHSGRSDITMINHIPCYIQQVESSRVPLELISEYPDETIYGDDFLLGHNVQTKVVLFAYDIYQSLVDGAPELTD